MFDVSHKIQVDLAILLADYSCFFLNYERAEDPNIMSCFITVTFITVHDNKINITSANSNEKHESSSCQVIWLNFCGKWKLEGMWLLFGPFFMFSKFYRLDAHNNVCAILGDLRWSINKIRIENWTSPYLVNYVIGSACFLIPKSNAWVISICGCYGV